MDGKTAIALFSLADKLNVVVAVSAKPAGDLSVEVSMLGSSSSYMWKLTQSFSVSLVAKAYRS